MPAENARVRHSALVHDLGVFAPIGWRVHLDNVEAVDDWFPVHPGMVVLAFFAPLDARETVAFAAALPLDGIGPDSPSGMTLDPDPSPPGPVVH